MKADYLRNVTICPKEAKLVLPFYYSNDMVFQRGPSAHFVWGSINRRGCQIVVKEACTNGYSEEF